MENRSSIRGCLKSRLAANFDHDLFDDAESEARAARTRFDRQTEFFLGEFWSSGYRCHAGVGSTPVCRQLA